MMIRSSSTTIRPVVSRHDLLEIVVDRSPLSQLSTSWPPPLAPDGRQAAPLVVVAADRERKPRSGLSAEAVATSTASHGLVIRLGVYAIGIGGLSSVCTRCRLATRAGIERFMAAGPLALPPLDHERPMEFVKSLSMSVRRRKPSRLQRRERRGQPRSSAGSRLRDGRIPQRSLPPWMRRSRPSCLAM